MQNDYLKYKKIALVIILSLFFGLGKAIAEPDSEKIRDLLISSQVEEVINIFDKDYIKRKKWNLTEENSYYYAIALLVDGKIDELKVFLKQACNKYPKSKNLISISNQINYFTEDFQNIKPNPEADEHIKLISQIKNYKLESPNKENEKTILEAINSLKNNVIYFPTKTDYYLELNTNEALKQAEILARQIIDQKKHILFPNTLDHYELASSYKVLSVANIKTNDLNQATRYIKMARDNIYKMRSIWIIEDIIINRPILKTKKRSTIFGYAVPQWIILLRDEYDNYLVKDVS